MMNVIDCEEIEKYDICKAFYVPKDQARWRIYSFDAEDGMADMKYYEELGKIYGIEPSHMVRVPQKHTDNIRIVTKDVAGEGVVREEPVEYYDGSVTSDTGIMLLTIQSDCTPVFILDPTHKAIGMVHSGWRGTCKDIAYKAIINMKKLYGTREDDVIVHFGPSICGKCYEVGPELIDEFKAILDDSEIDKVFKKRDDGKYLLDVTEAIRLRLIKDGIKKTNITRSRYCTFHDNIFDSWRRDGDKTKQMLTGIMLI